MAKCIPHCDNMLPQFNTRDADRWRYVPVVAPESRNMLARWPWQELAHPAKPWQETGTDQYIKVDPSKRELCSGGDWGSIEL
jgi:hypothetical protein